MERVAVYAGSFDPVTLGHVDMIRRGLQLFDRIIVLVGYNPAKQGTFTPEERVELLRRCVGQLPGVEIDTWTGLTVDYARRHGACALLRGVRSAADWDAEQQLALVNRAIAPELQTVLLPADPVYAAVSSSNVRQMAAFGAPIEGFVPREIIPDIEARLRK